MYSVEIGLSVSLFFYFFLFLQSLSWKVAIFVLNHFARRRWNRAVADHTDNTGVIETESTNSISTRAQTECIWKCSIPLRSPKSNAEGKRTQNVRADLQCNAPHIIIIIIDVFQRVHYTFGHVFISAEYRDGWRNRARIRSTKRVIR